MADAAAGRGALYLNFIGLSVYDRRVFHIFYPRLSAFYSLLIVVVFHAFYGCYDEFVHGDPRLDTQRALQNRDYIAYIFFDGAKDYQSIKKTDFTYCRI